MPKVFFKAKLSLGIGRRGRCRGGESKTRCKKADCEGDARRGKCARQEKPRGGGHNAYEIAIAVAKIETHVAAIMTGNIWVACQSDGASKNPLFVVLCRSSEEVS